MKAGIDVQQEVKQLDQTFDEVLRKFEGLIFTIAKSCTVVGCARMDFDDLRQECRVVLYQVWMDRPDLHKDEESFGNVFKACVRNRMQDLARTTFAQKNHPGKEVPVQSIDWDLGYKENIVDNVHSNDLVQSIKDRLEPFDQEVFQLLLEPDEKLLQITNGAYDGRGAHRKPTAPCYLARRIEKSEHYVRLSIERIHGVVGGLLQLSSSLKDGKLEVNY